MLLKIYAVSCLPLIYSAKTHRFGQTVNYVPMSLCRDEKRENSFRFAGKKRKKRKKKEENKKEPIL